MKSFFDFLTRLALRFRGITLAIVAIVIVLGGVAASDLNQELLPPVEFPQIFILGQVSGMTSEQVLSVVTERVEDAISDIPEIVNVESQTSGSFGAFITASNDFGIDQDALRDKIQATINGIYFPTREIAPDDGSTGEEFASELLADMSADVLIFLADTNPNFLFQLSPAVWQRLSDETVRELAGYLANQTSQPGDAQSALEQLVEQEVAPQLDAVDSVARIEISGGQSLPSDGAASQQSQSVDVQVESLLLQLSPDVWQVIAPRLEGVDAQNQEAVEALRGENYSIPQSPPALPDSWQMDHFLDASDLNEMASLTRSIAAVFNQFIETGRISGALGNTNDLTPEVINRMLEIEPSLVNYFDAEHLAAMPPEVFDALPDDLNLDGFARDELAASALATALTGEDIRPEPVRLPAAWRIQPPQIITFSFADLPLATFSVFGTAVPDNESAEGATASTADEEGSAASESSSQSAGDSEASIDVTEESAREDIPEGPALPQLFALFGDFLGAELNTADDLIQVRVNEQTAQLFGSEVIRAADLLNGLLLLENAPATATGDGATGAIPGLDAESLSPVQLAQFVPALSECNITLSDLQSDDFSIAEAIIGCLSADTIRFIVENDPSFAAELQAGVIEYFQPEVLQVDGIAPKLGDAWSTLAEQPEFEGMTFDNADDLLQVGNGSASRVLNTINAEIPDRFSGYEVRLFDSLSPRLMNYLAENESNFYQNLDSGVILKLSPDVLGMLPDDVVEALPDDVADDVQAIASGEQSPAIAQLSGDYQRDVPPPRPDAPALNPEWQTLAEFFGVEFNNAYDLFRFPEVTGTPAQFINGLFDSPQGSNFAGSLLGNMPPEAFDYIADEDPDFISNLEPRALQLLPDEIYENLPESARERAESGTVFIPQTQVTRTNGSTSLLVTVYKNADANTVEAFYAVQNVINQIDNENEAIDVEVAFEQASFIEESVSSVVTSGVLGAFFAIVNILIFLSSTQHLSWRPTLVIAVSIPLSILAALALMRWLPLGVGALLSPIEQTGFAQFVTRLAPEGLTLNIMTLSGLTVAIGRLVDDSIVVLENIFRQLQSGQEKREAVIYATQDVSVAIFSATSIAVIVFLPLGLTGGLIAEFFLPFGLAVMYTLLSSFLTAITVVPVLAYFLLSSDHVPTADETWMERLYVPVLEWVLAKNWRRVSILIFAIASMIFSGYLFSQRPASFLPDFGEKQISVSINMPQNTPITETDDRARQVESIVRDVIPENDLTTVRTIVGGGGLSFDSLLGGGGVSENIADVTISVESTDDAILSDYREQIESQAIDAIGEENVSVSVGSLSSGGGFGGFEMVVSAPNQEVLETLNPEIIATLESLPELSNVQSSLSGAGTDVGGGEGGQTYIRINQSPALSYTGTLQTEDTINFTSEAIEAVRNQVDLPEGVSVGQGFDSQLQSEGFSSIFVAMSIALVLIIIILVVVFQSPVYGFVVILSVIVAPVGAAIALTLADMSLGISALIGLLMLLGLVVTNAIVLIDRVSSNRLERGMSLYEALVEAGGRRVRPILMTALTTIIGLIPLAIGLSEGAIIASSLGTVVIGGIISSTLLTLLVVPAAYYLATPLHDAFIRMLKGASDGVGDAAEDKRK